MRKRAALLVLFLTFPAFAGEGRKLTAAQAGAHVGEHATVCGKLFASYRSDVKGEPTFLNIDNPHPYDEFYGLIWGEDRERFGAPEVTLDGKRVCITGTIQTYKGKPQIIVREKSQLREDTGR